MRKLLIFTYLLMTWAGYAQTTSGFDANKLDWLVGSWEGEGLDGLNYESWSTPVDGVMIGMFRHTKNDKIIFYEFCRISKVGLQLKHFNSDFNGWEEKNEMITFPFLFMSDVKVVFDGLEMELVNESELKIIVQLEDGETTFNYKRKN
ncbi:DUF6265 family protein [Fulvivirga lutea]|uniref:DUF6265 domain-containing protein n=1 Tax=Fulvivirga lutea TaxID=2810512 RepID=A0A974WKM0_9BACT|nr:DUF6265 family protein [Fulvivirga lutea]QSE97098.1 hypothetical protein JR347_16115 [Fulvivirga lutea]